MKKVILGLISLTVLIGCSTGDQPGPADPTAGNVEAQKQKTEKALDNVPPEFRDKARAAAQGSPGMGYQPPPKKGP
ncbi:MAG: hypothetical protein JST12_21110 [Armatimonadetes bacterium]|nr:hypothetical protein [Armatimonadota bacterium]MBS1704176.1 hypothetical protein [Armatimonadota bacterium]